MRSSEAQTEWSRACESFAGAIEAYLGGLGIAPGSPQLDSAVRTNTELVPQRTRDLLFALRELAGFPGIDGMRILDAGCGWGSMSIWIAMHHPVEQVVAIDNRQEFLDAAVRAAAVAGVRNVEFVMGDMTGALPIPAAEFDLVIANNTLLYIRTPEQLAAALGSLHRAARDGGYLIAHQANRLQLRDPFTDAPLVHLLSPRAAARVGRLTHWQNSHDRVRMVSAQALKREAEKAGFHGVRTGAIGANERLATGMASRFGRFFVLTARAS